MRRHDSNKINNQAQAQVGMIFVSTIAFYFRRSCQDSFIAKMYKKYCYCIFIQPSLNNSTSLDENRNPRAFLHNEETNLGGNSAAFKASE